MLLKLDEYEHRSQYEANPTAFEDLADWLSQKGILAENDEESPLIASERLGCSKSENGIKTGGWAGLVRLQGSLWRKGMELQFSQELAVLPRSLKDNLNSRVDLVQMYLECLGNPIVASHMGEPAVFVWPDQEPIECPHEFKEDALIFLALSYISELHWLCLHHLRNQFTPTTQNLTGRIKGRIEIGKQLRVNLARGRADRTVCSFITHSDNCRENQILKTALERSSRLLSRYKANIQPIWSKVHFCRNELGNVDEIDVTPKTFQGIRYNGLFKPYQKAHQLAKYILNALPPSPHSSELNKVTAIPPFAICTYELFERYCEVQLRKIFAEPKLWVGYRDKALGKQKDRRLRPDFLLRSLTEQSQRWIIDAKNKPRWNREVEDSKPAWDSDVPQLCRYSRYIPILEELGFKEEEYVTSAPNMLILYPASSNEVSKKLSESYFAYPDKETSIKNIQNFFAFPISVPTRSF